MKQFISIFALVAVAMAHDNEDGLDNMLSSANLQFTAKMFSAVTKENPNKSVVMSAFSVLSPLSQLALASVGASHDELLRAIGLPNDNVTKAVFTKSNSQLREVKGVELKMANRLFIPDGFQLNEQFETVLKDSFDSEVKNLDFSKNQEAADEINSWVESQTNNRIKDLVNPDALDANTRTVLVNAIYFKGSWEDKFDKNNTMDRDFHVTKDKVIQVPTMFTIGDFRYGESEELDAKLLEMFYEGREVSFLIILPNKIDGLAALEEKLKEPQRYLPKALSDMHTNEVHVYLPKCKIETKINLKDVLLKLGIEKLFSPGEAMLNNLLKGESDLYVSDAIQKAFIEVNEEGAEAAASNVFPIRVVGGIWNIIKADRPFYYELRYNHKTVFNGIFGSSY